MKLSIKDFFSKCDQMVTFTEGILNGKLHFFCAAMDIWVVIHQIKSLKGVLKLKQIFQKKVVTGQTPFLVFDRSILYASFYLS